MAFKRRFGSLCTIVILKLVLWLSKTPRSCLHETIAQLFFFFATTFYVRQVMEMLAHINKRLRSRALVQLPVNDLIAQYTSDETPTFVSVCSCGPLPKIGIVVVTINVYAYSTYKCTMYVS